MRPCLAMITSDVTIDVFKYGDDEHHISLSNAQVPVFLMIKLTIQYFINFSLVRIFFDGFAIMLLNYVTHQSLYVRLFLCLKPIT